jgi:Family of unknown function (DUF6459)
MPAEPVLASRDHGEREESAGVPSAMAMAIVTLPPHWPPPDLEFAASTESPGAPDGRRPALEQGPALPRQFAVLLAEVLTARRPVRQLAPWLSKRGSIHLQRLLPLFNAGHQPRVQRVLTARPAPDVVEMTVIVVIGARTRALAIRLEHAAERWLCTDIEAA